MPSGTHSHYGTRRTVRDEGVGTHERPVRAAIQHSGAMTGGLLRRLQERAVPSGTHSHCGVRAPYATKESEPANRLSERQSNTAAL